MGKVKEFKGFLELSIEKKKLLLYVLGYKINKKGFLTKGFGRKVKCKYTEKPIHINNAAILPGSTIVINSTTTAISSYLEEYIE